MANNLYLEGVENETIIQASEMNLISILKPHLSIDGNAWCFLYGEDLQNGVAGFGPSPYLAALDFNKAFYAKLPDQANPNDQ